MKYTYKDKLEMYRLWKEKHYSTKRIAKRFKCNFTPVDYMVKLIDIHGLSIVKRNKYKQYSAEFKEDAIRRVLINNESATQVSLSMAIRGCGTLSLWIKSYKENGYNVIERKRGRYGQKESAEDRIRSRITETDTETSEAKHEAFDRERILKKIRCLNFRKGKARAEEVAHAITELRQELKCSLRFILFTINSIPDVPHMTRSDYYYTINKIDKDEKNQELIETIKSIYAEHKKRYGYRRITLELVRQGYNVNHKKVQRLMKIYELRGITPRTKYKSYKGDFNRTVKNLLLNKVVDTEKHQTYYIRDFTTTDVNQKWTTDVSEFHIAAGKLYLSPILDMHNAEIVSFNISKSPNFYQTTDMLNKAFQKFQNLEGLIFHSDQGWQYQMFEYHSMLRERGIIQSMSRKGNCYDNSIMENFFGKMKNEMFYGHEYEFNTLNELKDAMEKYIYYYNNDRIQQKLKGRTPSEVRNSALKYV